MPVHPEQPQTVILHGLGAEGQAALAHFTRQSRKPGIVLIRPDTEEGVGTLPEGIAEALSERRFPAALAAGRFPAGTNLETLYLRSPGVPPSNPCLQAALAAGLPVTTPTGYWLAALRPARTLTITGTKGKSTATALMAHLLSAAGFPARAVGNLGRHPLAEAWEDGAIAIAELSSYMLHDCWSAAPVHVVINLFREHTDWHGSEEAYAAAKLRPFALEPACHGVVPMTLQDKLKAYVNPHTVYDQAIGIAGGTLSVKSGPWAGRQAPMTDRRFAHPPLRMALQAAVAALMAAGWVGPEPLLGALPKALERWKGLPARQQVIGRWAGRIWVDDTLATIPEATLLALKAFGNRPVRLICGGKDRGQEWRGFIRILCEKTDVGTYVYGPVAPALEAAHEVARKAALEAVSVGAGGATAPARLVLCADFDEACRRAFADSRPGEVILLSPAAASSPPHTDFKARGAAFAAFGAAQGPETGIGG